MKYITIKVNPLFRVICLIICGLLSHEIGFAKKKKPNVIIILTDDQGYGDISAHGNKIINTPNIDKLHSESVRFTDFHVDPTCAPTRSALMSGKYSHHVGVWHTVRGGNHLRASEITLADVFNKNGYQTGLFGKWHLGANYPYRPMDRGFQEWLGQGDGGTGTTDDYFWNDRVNDMYWHNGKQEYIEGYTPDVFYNKAQEFIRKRNPSKPFFVYLPTYIPHGPFTHPKKNFYEKYMKMGLNKHVASFYAVTEHLDENIGKLRAFLKEEEIEDNTILIFMTDNGSAWGWKVFNAGMSGGKGSTLDGGHRVPCFIYWKDGKIMGGKDINTLTAHIDIMPTLIDLCKLKIAKDIDFDGRSLKALIYKNSKDWKERTLVVETQRKVEQTPTVSAIMTEKWRLVGHEKLYNIKEDPAQKKDLAEQYPEVVKQLMAEFQKYWTKVIPNDREIPYPVVGTKYDKEIFLGVSELREGKERYHHGQISSGLEVKGAWHIDIAKAGRYEFEVSRWASEVNTPFRALPKVTKTVDAWSPDGAIKETMYKGEFTKLPIQTVTLKVGDFEEQKQVRETDTSITFEVNLPKGKVAVESQFLDAKGSWLTNAYYMYVRKADVTP